MIKKLVFVLSILLAVTSFADTTQVAKDTAKAAIAESTQAAPVITQVEEDAEPKQSIHQIIKDKFIEGGPLYMGAVLVCLIIGLAVAIERVITINLATINTSKFTTEIRESLSKGGVKAAETVCAKTPGPVAAIYAQGLSRVKEGIDSVEKSVIGYGSVEMGKLEKGLSWISLFIALAPMLGFMGTVIGMIEAFDTIEKAEDIKIDEVASGIKVALLTTVAGLIVAIILQIFYNYLVSKIDSLVNSMEEASILLVDMILDNDLVSKK